MKAPARTSNNSMCTWIFENADFGIIITDHMLRITDTNSWVHTQSGKSYNEMQGKNILDVFPEIRERKLNQYLDQAIGGAYVILSARFHRYFLRFPDDSGEMKQTVRISPMLNDDIVTGLIIHIEDVTERFNREEQMHLKNEELQKLNITKDKFFRIIAHDLRSPFTALLGFSEILRDNYENTPEQTRKDIIDTLHQAIKDQFTLLENLLKWSQLQTGHFELSFSETNLHDIINHIFSIARPVILSKEFHVIRDEAAEDVMLNTDRQALTSVLYNLVFNALKFTQPGGTIDISVNKENNSVSISVRDTGVGISRERMNKLFRIDESVSTPGTNRERGTGLGLILVKELTDKLGGSIYVDSQPGVGSTFTVRMPVKQ